MTTNGSLNRKFRMALVGGGHGAFIGRVHATAAVLDNRAELVAGCLSSNPDRAKAAVACRRPGPAAATAVAGARRPPRSQRRIEAPAATG